MVTSDHDVTCARFASEYGFQSWPGWEVVAAVSEAEDWSLASAWAGHRQHHPGGNMELVWQIRLNMDLDQVSWSVRHSFFARYSI